MKANGFITLLLSWMTYYACSLSTTEVEGDDKKSSMPNVFLSGNEIAPKYRVILPTHSVSIALCGNNHCDSNEEALSCPSDCSNLELATANVGSNLASVRLVFSIKSFRDVMITSIDIFTQSLAVPELVQVYTVDGEYSRYEMPREEWELVYDNPALELLGTHTPTALNDLNVFINAGMVKSFLLYTPNMFRCIATKNDQRIVPAMDSNIVMYEGVGVTDMPAAAVLFPSELLCSFTGAIRYNVSGPEQPGDISVQMMTSKVTTSKAPTKKPMVAPTRSPTSRPTFKSPTKIPTKPPTKTPTSKPSSWPSTKVTTSNPTSLVKKINFVAFGDIPYTKIHRYCLNKQLRELNQATMDFKFMVHIGDIKQGTTSCYESSFSDIAEMFSHPKNAISYDTQDCFFVPGDNEFQDCQDRTQAWMWWMKYFGNGIVPNARGFGTLSDPSIVVYYEQEPLLTNNEYPTSAGNFAFYTSNTLFVGINQVGGGTVGDESTRVQGNYKWVEFNMAKYSTQGMRVLVVFAHASMISARSQYFGTPFMSLLRQKYSNLKVLYLHGDSHNYRYYHTDSNNLNLINVEVEGGEEADPLLISVMYDTDADVYSFNIDARGGYYSSGCVAGNVDKTWSSNY